MNLKFKKMYLVYSLNGRDVRLIREFTTIKECEKFAEEVKWGYFIVKSDVVDKTGW